jgi:hypothetical protein
MSLSKILFEFGASVYTLNVKSETGCKSNWRFARAQFKYLDEKIAFALSMSSFCT